MKQAAFEGGSLSGFSGATGKGDPFEFMDTLEALEETEDSRVDNTLSGDTDFHSGFVALVGRPNAGKSTLINALMKKKLAITSSTAQTTRHRFRAVLTRDSYQIVLVDTPGLHKPEDALGEALNAKTTDTLSDVDILCMLIDASAPVGRGDEWVARCLANARARKICILTKTDLVNPEQLEAQLERVAALGIGETVISLSAVSGTNLDVFESEIASRLPQGPLWFPKDMETDQSMDIMVAEFIREKILREFYDEIPHAIGVTVEELVYDKKKKLHRIFAIIYVERKSQKGIIIGKGGNAIKEIGIKARADLETLLGTRVYLDLQVKLKEKWRRDLNQIRRFGYGD